MSEYPDYIEMVELRNDVERLQERISQLEREKAELINALCLWRAWRSKAYMVRGSAGRILGEFQDFERSMETLSRLSSASKERADGQV